MLIYTIGTSDRSLADFLQQLQSRKIRHLIDARSSPYSRYSHFSRPQMQRWCEHEGVFYDFAGEVLGGRCDLSAVNPAFVARLRRVVDASLREPVALMCAEGDPRVCHRTTKLAAALLVTYGITAVSILRDGNDEVVTKTLAAMNAATIPEEIRHAVQRSLGRPTTPRLL